MTEAVLRPLEMIATDAWDDPARGRIAWKTIFSADRTPSDSLTCGVAIMEPGDWLAPHRHEPAEIYFGIEGSVTVTVDGADFPLGPGDSLFIPGNALHSVRAGAEPARYFYVFPRDSFTDVDYVFGPA